MRGLLTAVIIILGVLLLMVILLIIESRRELNMVRLSEYFYSGPKLNKALDGKNFIFLSDFHEAQGGRLNSRILDMVREASPEMILVGGDMLNGTHEDEDITPSVSLITELSKIAPVFMASGNHEMKVREGHYGYVSLWNRFYDGIKDKVTYIDNMSVFPSTAPIKLYGLDLEYDYYKRQSRKQLEMSHMTKLIGDSDGRALNILLAHDPEYYKVYADWGADIVLSGHYHGGIIRIPGLGGVISPKLVLFPKPDYGMVQTGDSTMYLTCGLGQHTMKLRVNNIPEVVKVTFKAG